MWSSSSSCFLPLSVHAEDLGELSANPFNPDSTSNPFSPYGSPSSNQSATHSRTNPYGPDLTSNPYGSPDPIKNPFGAGNPYNPSSPTNPYGCSL